MLMLSETFNMLKLIAFVSKLILSRGKRRDPISTICYLYLLESPGSGWCRMSHSSAWERDVSVDESMVVRWERGDGGQERRSGSLHHHSTALSLPHHGEGGHTHGVGLTWHKTGEQVLQAESVEHVNLVSDGLTRHHGAEVNGVASDVSSRSEGGQPGDQDGGAGGWDCLDVGRSWGRVLQCSTVHRSALHPLPRPGHCCHLHCVVLIFLKLCHSQHCVLCVESPALSNLKQNCYFPRWMSSFLCYLSTLSEVWSRQDSLD